MLSFKFNSSPFQATGVRVSEKPQADKQKRIKQEAGESGIKKTTNGMT
jgi:hypothetical protein